MKNLTIEEKARAYDKAIEVAQKLYQDCPNGKNDRLYHTTDLEKIFPQLCESDDENIRKEIVSAINIYCSEYHRGTKVRNDMLTWVEKQGELVNSLSKGLDDAHERIDGLIQKNNELCIKLEKPCKQESNKMTIWNHWKDGICGNGEGKLIYLIKDGDDYSLSSCLAYECDYIELSDLDKLMEQEKQGIQKPNLYERYKKISESEWFKKTHEGMSVSDDEKVDNVNKVEPKFKVGEWIIYSNEEVGLITGFDDNGYFVDKESYIPFNCEGNMRLWTIDDARDGDVLSNGEMIVIFKHFEKPSYRQHIVAYIGLDRCGCIQITDDTWNLGIDKAKPATNEQRDLLFSKMREAGYEWDDEKKELKKAENRPMPTDFFKAEYERGKADAISEMQKSWTEDDKKHMASILTTLLMEAKNAKIEQYRSSVESDIDWIHSLKNKDRVQPKQKWSEEDEANSYHLKTLLENLAKDIKHEFRVISDEDRDKYTAWLNSLRNRITWKPSEEQMDALWDKISNDNLPNSEKEISQQVALTELYEQLKKLIE